MLCAVVSRLFIRCYYVCGHERWNKIENTNGRMAFAAIGVSFRKTFLYAQEMMKKEAEEDYVLCRSE